MLNNNPQGISSKVKHLNNEDDKEDNSMGNQLTQYKKPCQKSGLKVDDCGKKICFFGAWKLRYQLI